MEAIEGILQNTNIADVVKRARERSYAKRLPKDVEKQTKDIRGVLVPNAFQTPNEIVDDGWLGELNGAELKVLIFLIRKTFGFNKIAGDQIPFSQIQAATKLSRQSCMAAVGVLEGSGLIEVKRGRTEDGMRQINLYRLIVREQYYK